MPARRIRNRPETLLAATLLSGVGGYLDAYTYLWHHVFANAQSGNVVLMSMDVAQGRWGAFWSRVPAVVAFLVGLVGAQVLATGRARALLRHPARWVLGTEAAILVVLGFAPHGTSTVTLTAVVSFVAALQVSTFTSVRTGDDGVTYNTTMATGNLRSFVTAAFERVVDGDAAAGTRARVFGSVVAAFGAGACVGTWATHALDTAAAWPAAAVLLAVLGLVVRETRRRRRLGLDA